MNGSGDKLTGDTVRSSFVTYKHHKLLAVMIEHFLTSTSLSDGWYIVDDKNNMRRTRHNT